MNVTTKPAPRVDQVCVGCGKPFVFGPVADPRANVYTNDGKKEAAISGLCERCFDECTLPEDVS